MSKDFIKTDQVEEIVQSLDMAAGRRAFIRALGLGAISTTVLASAAGLAKAQSDDNNGAGAKSAAAVSDSDILNFALNLEYLESAFYFYAATGVDVPASNTIGGSGQPAGQITGGQKANLSSPLVKAYAKEIADEELKHVQILRVVLGKSAVARPALNIGSAFAAAATAAGVPGGSSFSPYKDDVSFLIGSYIFEDVGVTAYHGAAGLLQNKTYLNYAAGILAVEAYHAGIIRTSLFAAQNAQIVQTTQQISDLRSKLANQNKPNVDDVGIGTASAPTLVPVGASAATMFNELQPGGDAIAYARTTDQVLKIVYGNLDKSPGLFFPSGTNGTIK